MQTAVDVIRRIVSKNNLSFLTFDIYSPKGWKDNTIKHFKDDKKPGERRDPLGAVEHSPPSGLLTLSSATILGPNLNEIIDRRPAGLAMQVLSPTFHHTKKVHIPMLDVGFAPNEENLKYLLSCLRALGEENGVILLSGASYHYYGYRLLSNSEWQKFMYKSLLLDEVVDTRWVGHRLIDGFSWLRITPKGQHNFIPYVVAEL